MKTWEEIHAELSAPFPADEIKWRIGATDNKDNPTTGIPLAYIDARAVMERLDAVVGPENWWDEYEETHSGRVICKLTLRRGDGTDDYIPKSDGAGSTDMEGEKGGLSDAFKRAAVKWGVGRYLYSLGTQWVPVKRKGRSVVIAGKPPELPDWALPKNNVVPIKREELKLTTEEATPSQIENDPSQNENVMKEKFSDLYRKGIKTLGGEKFMTAVNRIIEHGYGGKDWKELPKDEQRKFYMDVADMIKNGGN